MSQNEQGGGTQHNWDLRGGARGETSKPSIPTGYVLFQCEDCGLAAARQITGRNSNSLSSIVPPPDVDEDCPTERDYHA